MKADVQKLREITGAGVMDCKRALDEGGGDIDKATTIIRERGLGKAAKKAGRDTSSGVIDAYIHNDRVGVLIELDCETDFVAKTDEFKTLAREIAMQIAAMNPADVDELLLQQYIRDGAQTVGDLITQNIAKIGENIKVGRFVRFEI